MENPIKMDDLGVPLFLETPTYHNMYNHSPAMKKIIMNSHLEKNPQTNWQLGHWVEIFYQIEWYLSSSDSVVLAVSLCVGWNWLSAGFMGLCNAVLPIASL